MVAIEAFPYEPSSWLSIVYVLAFTLFIYGIMGLTGKYFGLFNENVFVSKDLALS